MFDRSRKSLGVALIVSAALVAATTPSFAHNAAYCDRYARHEASAGSNDAMMWILPLAALGAGAGAVVGVAAVGAGIAVGTGAAVGGASGAAVGAVGSATHHGSDYNAAYDACIAGAR